MVGIVCSASSTVESAVSLVALWKRCMPLHARFSPILAVEVSPKKPVLNPSGKGKLRIRAQLLAAMPVTDIRGVKKLRKPG